MNHFTCHRVTAFLLVFAATLPAVAAPYVDLRVIEPIHGDATAGAAKAVVCAACHGPNGNSIVPMFPRLAGQRADYLYHRLVAFKNADPKDPYFSQSPMPAQAASLSDADMRNVAAYFAAQTPAGAAVSTADTGKSSRGETLYREGDSVRGAPPCQGCHGADATGPGSNGNQYAAYPSLRGQHAPYLTSRLTNFRNKLPHGSSNDFIMQGVAHTLDDAAIASIAAWLDALPPAKAP